MSQPTLPVTIHRSFISRVFISEQGLRSGWSLALFLFIYATLTLGAQFSFATIPVLRDWAAKQPHGVVSPLGQIAFTGLELLILLISVAVTARVEKRSWRYYGLSVTGRNRIRFFQGVAFGFGMASVLMGLIALLGGFSAGGLAIRGTAILSNGILYGIGFILVGFFEEFAFRGYLQATLQRGIGMWPAAVSLSLAFGAMHLPNSGVTWVGAVVAAGFGMLGVFSLYRTGALWFIIGTHAAFDWSIAFFYSTPIAGLPAQVHLVNASLHGPEWLTGGRTGPMGSIIMLAVLAFAGVAVHFIFPRVETKTGTLFQMAQKGE
jgi:membrane protease YdiL (CAAX protease family)